MGVPALARVWRVVSPLELFIDLFFVASASCFVGGVAAVWRLVRFTVTYEAVPARNVSWSAPLQAL
ncbi:hypothetical protein ACWDXT_33180 [Streptomyces sp. NPDC003236]